MNIQTMHFVSLDGHEDSDIGMDDRCFVRTKSGTWFETNGHLGDQYDQVEDKPLALRLEAKFWKTMYHHKIEF